MNSVSEINASKGRRGNAARLVASLLLAASMFGLTGCATTGEAIAENQVVDNMGGS